MAAKRAAGPHEILAIIHGVALLVACGRVGFDEPSTIAPVPDGAPFEGMPDGAAPKPDASPAPPDMSITCTTDCTLDCATATSCTMDITCAPGATCDFTCSAPGSCTDATIDCTNATCDFYCTDDTCNGMTVDCIGGTCTFHCCGSNLCNGNTFNGNVSTTGCM